VPLASPGARWLIAATVLGSGIALLDGTVVNVALPTIGREFGAGLTGQQWILDGYLLTLSALLLSGGAAGDRYGRCHVFIGGLVVFTAASLACGLSPTAGWLIGARLVQGVGAAALVPGSLALIDAGIIEKDRGRAVGIWAGASGVTTALGPFVGGWLVDAASWRWVFFLNIPLAAAAMWIAARHVAESRDTTAQGRPDILGAAAVTLGLAGVIYALIEAPSRGWTPITVTAAAIGATALVAFLLIEKQVSTPLLPLELFRSRQFTGANITTLAVYAAVGGTLFLLAFAAAAKPALLGAGCRPRDTAHDGNHADRLPVGRRPRGAHWPAATHDGWPTNRRRGLGVDGTHRSRGVISQRGTAGRRCLRCRAGGHRRTAYRGRPRRRV
jgi:EmrB/QacA subfamily drug resistance transporter